MLANPLERLDVYKMGHMSQYVPGTDFVYSYQNARSNKYFDKMVFFGLQYYLNELQDSFTEYDAEEFIQTKQAIVGSISSEEEDNIRSLAELGYWPIEIRAVKEGTVMPTPNALYSIHSTNKRFPWVVGFIESFLLKTWYPTTVATTSMKYRKLVDEYCDWTGDGPREFMVHDFGYRSDSSEESAAISGAAHLISFTGSDTVPAYGFITQYYNTNRGNFKYPIMLSVPATEHSVMCSYGPDNELAAFERMLELYPTGILSIVSDTYDIWRVCTEYLPKLKSRIMARDGKVVIRPDSGDPVKIICGDSDAPKDSPAFKGVLNLLAELFGTHTNDKGFRELCPKIGLIYGDGMYYERYNTALARMAAMGYAANNLVIGCGGILRQGTRDTLGMALKATHVTVNGEHRDIVKTPVTDPGKRSHTGFIRVVGEIGAQKTLDHQKWEDCCDENDWLQPVFRDGKILKRYHFDEVRDQFRATNF